jgi:hypothetical protein
LKHQVFIERCRDSKPETAILLAKAIAHKYGIDPEQILGRLKEGSFRVKANLDFAEARKFMTYLEKEGALCRVVDEKGATVAQSSALIVTLRGKPAKGTTTMQESAEKDAQEAQLASTLTMEPQKVAEALPLHTPPPPPDGDYESGLAAAYTSTPSSQDLGALSDASESGSLRLETLDGSSAEEEAKKPRSSVADTSDVAAFLPPDALAEQNIELDMEPEEGPALAAAVTTPPPASEEAPAPGKSARISAAQEVQESLEEEDKAVDKGPKKPPHEAALAALSGSLTALSASERLRFAVGVVLAVFIGYGVVTLVASSQEASKYSPIIAELNAEYDVANTSVAWNALDDSRATAVETLEARRRGIVIMSIFVWFAVAGLFVFLWLRVVDWTRWEEVISDGHEPTPAP